MYGNKAQKNVINKRTNVLVLNKMDCIASKFVKMWKYYQRKIRAKLMTNDFTSFAIVENDSKTHENWISYEFDF